MQVRTFRLSDDSGSAGVIRFLSGFRAELAEGKTSSWVTVTRTGKFSDPRYGAFDITRDMLLSMVRNFDARTFGQDIFIDVNHQPGNGAAGKVAKLAVEGDRLRALVEWTPFGVESIKAKGYAYLSAEYSENFKDNEQGAQHGPLLLGAALTVRPVIKRLDPVKLSCDSDSGCPVLLHPELTTTLLQEISDMKDKMLKKLAAQLAVMKLAQANIFALVDAFDKALADTTDEAKAEVLLAQFDTIGKQLSEAVGDKATTIQLTAPSIGMTADDVNAAVVKALAQRDSDARTLAEKKDANLKVLSDVLAAAAGLDEDTRKALATDVADLITAEMSAAQVTALAAMQIKHGNELAVAKQLSAMGWNPAGSVHISVPDESSKKLEGIYRDNLKKTASFAMNKIKLSEKPHPFVGMVLAEFDRHHAAALHNEVRILSGETGMANVNFPVSYQREVIREALSDTNILNLVNTMVDPSATETTNIPYELRDVAAVYNDGIVYEGQEIHEGGITQEMDPAYIVPMKIALKVSNEVMHFSRASVINWDAYARNMESNARYMRELVARRIANEMQRSADAYGSIAVTGEAFDTQLTGANSIIKTVNYPIVRPHQVRNVRGQAVGTEENAIAIVLNGVTLSAYDGTNAQSAGTYYRVINYNLGYVQLLSNLGVPVTPADTGTNTIGYSKATNIVKVDLDVPVGSTLKKQLNFVLEGIGARKAMLTGDRFTSPDFMLMSPTLNDQLTNAEQFVESGKRVDANVSATGDLTSVKQLAAFGTNAPNIDLGDERIIIGQRGLLGYSISKPFMFGAPFEAVGATGKPVGKKITYGEEFSAIKVPTPVRNRMTSVLAYSFTGR